MERIPQAPNELVEIKISMPISKVEKTFDASACIIGVLMPAGEKQKWEVVTSGENQDMALIMNRIETTMAQRDGIVNYAPDEFIKRIWVLPRGSELAYTKKPETKKVGILTKIKNWLV